MAITIKSVPQLPNLNSQVPTIQHNPIS